MEDRFTWHFEETLTVNPGPNKQVLFNLGLEVPFEGKVRLKELTVQSYVIMAAGGNPIKSATCIFTIIANNGSNLQDYPNQAQVGRLFGIPGTVSIETNSRTFVFTPDQSVFKGDLALLTAQISAGGSTGYTFTFRVFNNDGTDFVLNDAVSNFITMTFERITE